MAFGRWVYMFSEATNLMRKLNTICWYIQTNTISHWIYIQQWSKHSNSGSEQWILYLSHDNIIRNGWEILQSAQCPTDLPSNASSISRFIFNSLHLLMIVNLTISCVQFLWRQHGTGSLILISNGYMMHLISILRVQCAVHTVHKFNRKYHVINVQFKSFNRWYHFHWMKIPNGKSIQDVIGVFQLC